MYSCVYFICYLYIRHSVERVHSLMYCRYVIIYFTHSLCLSFSSMCISIFLIEISSSPASFFLLFLSLRCLPLVNSDNVFKFCLLERLELLESHISSNNATGSSTSSGNIASSKLDRGPVMTNETTRRDGGQVYQKEKRGEEKESVCKCDTRETSRVSHQCHPLAGRNSSENPITLFSLSHCMIIFFRLSLPSHLSLPLDPMLLNHSSLLAFALICFFFASSFALFLSFFFSHPPHPLHLFHVNTFFLSFIQPLFSILLLLLLLLLLLPCASCHTLACVSVCVCACATSSPCDQIVKLFTVTEPVASGTGERVKRVAYSAPVVLTSFIPSLSVSLCLFVDAHLSPSPLITQCIAVVYLASEQSAASSRQ